MNVSASLRVLVIAAASCVACSGAITSSRSADGGLTDAADAAGAQADAAGHQLDATPADGGGVDTADAAGNLNDGALTDGGAADASYTDGGAGDTSYTDGGAGDGPCTGTATLTWDSPMTNTDGTCIDGLAGYVIYYGTVSGFYTQRVDLPLTGLTCMPTGVTTACGAEVTCSYVLTGLEPGIWYLAMTAYDTLGNESDFSNEVSKTVACP